MKDIHGWIALVTGGASGIGKLMALDLAERGARVAIWDLHETALQAMVHEAASRGLAITGMKCDVANRAEVYVRAQELSALLGPVDILVNNAGVVSGKSFLETSDEFVFTKDVVLPMFKTVCSLFDAKPLIVRLLPEESADDPSWTWYEGDIWNIVNKELKTASGSRHSTPHFEVNI